MAFVVDDENAMRQGYLRLTGRLIAGRVLDLGIEPALQPPAPKAPASPGQIPVLKFYKQVAARHKAALIGAGPQQHRLVDCGQRLRSEREEVVDIDLHAFT